MGIKEMDRVFRVLGNLGSPQYGKNQVAVVDSTRHEMNIPVETIKYKRLSAIRNALKLKIIASLVCMALGVYLGFSVVHDVNTVFNYSVDVEGSGTIIKPSLAEYDVIAPVYSNDWYKISNAGVSKGNNSLLYDSFNKIGTVDGTSLPGITYNLTEHRVIDKQTIKFDKPEVTEATGVELVVKARNEDNMLLWDESTGQAVKVSKESNYSIGELLVADRHVQDDKVIYDNMKLKSSYAYKNVGVTLKYMNRDYKTLYFVCVETGEAVKIDMSCESVSYVNNIVDKGVGHKWLARRNVDSDGLVSFEIY